MTTYFSLKTLVERMNPFSTKGMLLSAGYSIFITTENIQEAIEQGNIFVNDEVGDDREHLISRTAYLLMNGDRSHDWSIVINSEFIEKGLWPICKNNDVYLAAILQNLNGLPVCGIGDSEVIAQWLGEPVAMIEPQALVHVKEPMWQSFDWNYYQQSGLQVMEPEDYLDYFADEARLSRDRAEILNKLPTNFFEVHHLEKLINKWKYFPRYASFEFLVQDNMLAYFEQYPETIFALDSKIVEYITYHYYRKHEVLLPLQELYREKIFKNPDACARLLEHGTEGELITYFDKQQVLENEDFLARYYRCVKNDKVHFDNRLLVIKKPDNFYQTTDRKIDFFCYEYTTWGNYLNQLDSLFDGWQNDKQQIIDYLEKIREKLNAKHTHTFNGQTDVDIDKVMKDYAEIAERFFERLNDELSEDYDINRLFISIVPRVYEKMSEPMRRKTEFLERYINCTHLKSLSSIPEHAIFQLQPGDVLKRLVGKYPSVMSYTKTPQAWLDDINLVVLAMREMENMRLSPLMLDAIASEEKYAIAAISAYPPVYERFSLKYQNDRKLALHYLGHCYYYDTIKNNSHGDQAKSLPSSDKALSHIPKGLWYYHDFCIQALTLTQQVQHVVIQGIPKSFWNDTQFLNTFFLAVSDKKLKIDNLKKVPMPVYHFLMSQKQDSSLKTFQKLLFKLKIEQGVNQFHETLDVMDNIAQERENLGRMKI
jgi:hypothetical protein